MAAVCFGLIIISHYQTNNKYIQRKDPPLLYALMLAVIIEISVIIFIHLFGPHKKHMAGKQYVTDVELKQAVTSWLWTMTLISAIPQYKPWSPYWGKYLMPMMTTWKCDVYHLLPMCLE